MTHERRCGRGDPCRQLSGRTSSQRACRSANEAVWYRMRMALRCRRKTCQEKNRVRTAGIGGKLDGRSISLRKQAVRPELVPERVADWHERRASGVTAESASDEHDPPMLGMHARIWASSRMRVLARKAITPLDSL